MNQNRRRAPPSYPADASAGESVAPARPGQPSRPAAASERRASTDGADAASSVTSETSPPRTSIATSSAPTDPSATATPADGAGPPAWALTPDAVYGALGTAPGGLSEREAAARLARYGPNELPEPAGRPLIWRFVDQLTHFMALLLWVGGALAFVAAMPELGWAIWAVIWINGAFSFWQEYRAERALAELKQVLPARARVLRDGHLEEIAARDLVPGDLVQLEEGDRVSADARLVNAERLAVDLSVLTGESVPVPRSAEAVVPAADAAPRPAEIANLVLAGTTIAAGRGTAVVLVTGEATEFGRLAHLSAIVEREPSTLEIQVSRLVRVITGLAVGMGIVVFLLAYGLVGMELRESFIFAIGIIVANVPEGLLPTVTLALAIGVRRMARRRAVVRRLSAIETLSGTTVICTDKTGTLTRNELTVRRLWIPSLSVDVPGSGYDASQVIRLPSPLDAGRQVKLLLAGAALCSNARLVLPPPPDHSPVFGDPTEGALLVAARKAGLHLEGLQTAAPRIREVPFDSARKMMTVVLRWGLPDLLRAEAPYLAFTKGAPLELLDRCRCVERNGHVAELTEAGRAEIRRANDHLASQGYRVIGVAFRQGGGELIHIEADAIENELTFIGLLGMMDTPREGVAEAIRACRDAGITVTMVTGDYGLTARAIGQRIGLGGRQAVPVVAGTELGGLDDRALDRLLAENIRHGLIFARVTPEQKLRLVQAYKRLGHTVAVTGDGVNDAPALRAANIGIAMGVSGTDVAREAADVVLADDNFATIVAAIGQGRAVYRNLRKFTTYILASNVPEIVPFLTMVVAKVPPALNILQILAVDLGTDMVPALALGAEQPEEDVMRQPPRRADARLVDLPLLGRAYAFLGMIEAVVSMVSFFAVWWLAGYDLAGMQAATVQILDHTADAQVMAVYMLSTTMALAAIVFGQIGNVFACRSERLSIARVGLFSNGMIWLGIAVELALLLAIVYIPFFQDIFKTAPIPATLWLLLLAWPPLLLGAEEVRKWAAARLR